MSVSLESTKQKKENIEDVKKKIKNKKKPSLIYMPLL